MNHKKVFALIAALLFAPGLYASHLAAADIRAEYIGSGPTDLRYKAVLTIYAACEPVSMPLLTSELLHVKSTAIGFDSTRASTLVSLDTFDTYCPAYSGINSCRDMNSIYPGFIKAVYIDTFVLPARSADLTFSWRAAARNSAIQNLVANDFMYISCGINNMERYNAGTPIFAGEAVPYLQVNQVYRHANAAYDLQYDSLVTRARTPQTDSVTPVDYNAPYSPAMPVPGFLPYEVSPLSGNVNLGLANTGKFVLSFVTEKYDRRTRKLLGYATRDIQLVVLSGGGLSPVLPDTLSNLLGGIYTDSLLTTAAGVALSFDIESRAANVPALVSNNTVTAAGSVFTTSSPGAGRTSGHFTWTPAMSDTGYHYVLFNSERICDMTASTKSGSTLLLRILVEKQLPSSGVSACCLAGRS